MAPHPLKDHRLSMHPLWCLLPRCVVKQEPDDLPIWVLALLVGLVAGGVLFLDYLILYW